MASTPPVDPACIGTPRDYSEEMYRFYFELADTTGVARRIIMTCLGVNGDAVIELAHGYEFDMPIQCAPDVVRALARENIAVYQVVRFARTTGVWHPPG